MNPFHTALLEALAVKGLTASHITILKDDGFESPSQLLHLTIADLKSMLGIKGGLASDILSVAETAKSADFQTAQISKVSLIKTLLENLLGSDATRISAVKELVSQGVRLVVVNEDGGLLVGETMNLLSSPDRGSAERIFQWNEQALVQVETFLPDQTPLRSPYGGEALVEGSDPRTGITWGDLPRDRLGLAVWLVEEKMDAGQPQREVFSDLKSGGTLYQRALRLSKVRGLKEGDLRELAKVSKVSKVPKSPSPSPSPSPSLSPLGALHKLLLSLFSSSSFRRFMVHNLDFPDWELPAEVVPFTLQVDSILHTYRAQNDGFRDFFAALLREFPKRNPDINRVAALFDC